MLNDLTLYIPAGSITSVVGRSGSGKSTIGLLLLGLYNPKGGDITVDGIRISEYSPLWLRNRIGTVSQVNRLLPVNIIHVILSMFHGLIYFNLHDPHKNTK